MKKISQAIADKVSLSYLMFSVSIGGFMALYLSSFFSLKLLPALKEKANFIEVKKIMQHIPFSGTYMIVFMLSLLLLIVAPMIKKKESKFDSILTIAVVVTVIMASLELFLSMFSKQQTIFLIPVLWVLCTLTTLYIGRVTVSIYQWVHVETNTQYDVVKLTFIWGIIATILTILK